MTRGGYEETMKGEASDGIAGRVNRELEGG
jgi:hypothetical protein